MNHSDISCELWREYDFGGRIYRINHPKRLIMRPGGSIHRIVDTWRLWKLSKGL